MNRNVNDYFSKTPTPHYPRNKFDFGIHKRLQTQEHGRLYPFYCKMVYPGDTWQMDLSTFVRADTSLRVPLDDIYLDTYFFFVPLRILGEEFERAMGDVDSYDDTDWHFPYITISAGSSAVLPQTIDNILNYLNYSQSDVQIDNDGRYFYAYADKISAYPLMAYLKIWNDWFRDENLDPEVPIDDVIDASIDTIAANTLFNGLDCFKVNKFHDYFTSGVISPSKGAAAVTIPLGLSAPVVGDTALHSIVGKEYKVTPESDGSFATSSFRMGATANDGILSKFDTTTSGAASIKYTNMVADLSQAAGTINELYLAMALNSYYNKRARFGTRLIEQIRGQWGIEVPDSFFQRPEYLGGSRTTLNMVPVLSTENSSQLGQMSGNSSTLTGGVNFSKTFIEYGLIIGLSCTRIKHSYTQGKAKDIWQIFDPLDLYNPVFANIGFEPIYQYELFNQGTTNPTTVFNYQEAWANLRCDVDSFAGLFGIFSNVTEIKNKWHYGDYYSTGPTFSASWLKEGRNNVSRTMTGQLIAGASDTSGAYSSHQFMFAYYFHPKVTRILPSHSLPPEITGRI